LKAIFKAFDECGAPEHAVVSKAVSYTGDNASVNMGSENGVGVLLCERQPRVVVQGCASHLATLGFKGANGIARILESTADLVKGVGEFYVSPKEWRALQEHARKMGVSLLAFKRPFPVSACFNTYFTFVTTDSVGSMACGRH
jgi:hypothetical protein